MVGNQPFLHIYFSILRHPHVRHCHTHCDVISCRFAEIAIITTHVRVMPQSAGSPAMDHNGFVSSPPLYHQHLLNDCHDGRRGGTQTLRSPAGHLELSYSVFMA